MWHLTGLKTNAMPFGNLKLHLKVVGFGGVRLRERLGVLELSVHRFLSLFVLG